MESSSDPKDKAKLCPVNYEKHYFTKRRRAQSTTDYETWKKGGVVPTLNAFDNGDIRATTVIVVRMRQGKPGGGQRGFNE